METKVLLKSKTFWIAMLGLVTSFLQMVGTDILPLPTSNKVLFITSAVTIVIRWFYTNSAIDGILPPNPSPKGGGNEKGGNDSVNNSNKSDEFLDDGSKMLRNLLIIIVLSSVLSSCKSPTPTLPNREGGIPANDFVKVYKQTSEGTLIGAVLVYKDSLSVYHLDTKRMYNVNQGLIDSLIFRSPLPKGNGN